MRVAAIQTPGTTLDAWPQTLALLDDLAAQAAAGGARLAVLPECAWPAYVLGRRAAWDEARAAGLPGPEFFPAHLRDLARRLALTLCAGFVEEAAGTLYNSAVIASPHAGPTVRRKTFLWSFDRDWFTPGDRVEPLGPELHRAGVMICADARLPEIAATLAARGARLLLQPTAWVNAGTDAAPWNPQPDFLIRARAAEFGIPVISASKYGREGDTDFIGASLICDAGGEILAQCGPANTTVVFADIAPGPPRPPQLTPGERTRLAAPPVPPRADLPAIRIVLRAPASAGTGPALVLPADFLHQPPDTAALEPLGFVLQRLHSSAAERFAPARVAALAGAHLLLFAGPPAPDFLLQARACENRVFVLAVSEAEWSLIGPAGRVVERCTWPATPPGHTVRLEPGHAADKCVAPRTDILAGRDPALYCFTAP